MIKLLEWLKQHIIDQKYADDHIHLEILDITSSLILTYNRNLIPIKIRFINNNIIYYIFQEPAFHTTLEDPNSIPELLKAIKANPILYAKEKLCLRAYYINIVDILFWEYRGTSEMETAIKALNNSELEEMCDTTLPILYNESKTIAEYFKLIHSKGIEEARKTLKTSKPH